MRKDGDRVTDRDRLERDESGRTLGEVKREGRESKGKKEKTKRGTTKRNIFLIVVLAITVLMVMGLRGTTDMRELFREWSMTNEQGLAEVFNSVQELEDMNRRFGEHRGELDRGRLYHDAYITEQVAKEYLVYVYTGDEEKDRKFTEWFKTHRGEVPIYPIHIDAITTNKEVKSYIKSREPMVLIYNELERGKKDLEGVIKDAQLLDESIQYIQRIKEIKSYRPEKEG